MAVLCWMAVTLGLFLSAENSLAADVDQNQLAGIVTEILNRYRPSYTGSRGQRRRPMFSLAVSIPYDSKSEMYDISQVTDTREQVWQSILTKCEVYTSKRMVAATVLRWPNVVDQCPEGRVQWPGLTDCGQTWADVQNLCPTKITDGRADHAEYRTLQKINTLVRDRDKNDLLLFYVLASPCDKRCTSESSRWSILNSIKQIQQWNNYAVVFSDVFKPRGGVSIPEQDLRGAVERLGKSIGLSNIFRCNGDVVQCTSCSSGTNVTPYCYSDEAQRARSRSPSQGSQGERGKQSNNISPGPGVSTNVDSGVQGGTVSGGGKRRRKRVKGKKSKNTNDGDGVSASQSGLEVSNADVDSNTGGGGQGDTGNQSNNISPGPEVSTNVDSGGQGGTVSGGGKRRRKRIKGKKSKNANDGDGISASQSGLGVSNADINSNTGGGGRGGTVRKVGGRRVNGKKPKSQQGKGKKKKQTNKKKTTQNKGRTQWNQNVQGRDKKQKGQKSKQQQRQRGGKIGRIDQPQKKRKNQRRG